MRTIKRYLTAVFFVIIGFTAFSQTAEELFNQGMDYLYKKDYSKAAECFRKAADQGDAEAQYNLGVMYDNGHGVQQDYQEAVKWYRKSADQGVAEAQYNLGIMYCNGDGVQQNYQEAVKWYKKSADQGNAQAQYNLGDMYFNGYGVQQDYQEAVKWNRKAADQGVARAQYNLGLMYENGYGVQEDMVEALKWLEKAANQKYDLAIIKLDEYYETAEVYQMVEIMPEYPGGQASLSNYIARHRIYPEEASKNGIHGTVYVRCVIEIDGSIRQAIVVSGKGYGCDEEAIRVVKSLPRFKPGKQGGKPVRVGYTVPVTF